MMHTFANQTDFDVIVVGGSYAGLSAALQLARARHDVLVVDSARRRNRFANRSHGFLTQDGSEAGRPGLPGPPPQAAGCQPGLSRSVHLDGKQTEARKRLRFFMCAVS